MKILLTLCVSKRFQNKAVLSKCEQSEENSGNSSRKTLGFTLKEPDASLKGNSSLPDELSVTLYFNKKYLAF